VPADSWDEPLTDPRYHPDSQGHHLGLSRVSAREWSRPRHRPPRSHLCGALCRPLRRA